jgi:hypothetical protein
MCIIILFRKILLLQSTDMLLIPLLNMNSVRCVDVGRYGRMWGGVGGCEEVWADVGMYGTMRGVLGGCGDAWAEVGRFGRMWGGVDGCGEMWADVGRCGQFNMLCLCNVHIASKAIISYITCNCIVAHTYRS